MPITMNMLLYNLEQERARLIDELEVMKSYVDPIRKEERVSSFYKTEEAADMTMDLERQVIFETQVRYRLASIEHALDKIDSGTYGICDKCGGQIDPKRLEALPESALCVTCKAEAEKNNGLSNSFKLSQPIFSYPYYERYETGDYQATNGF